MAIVVNKPIPEFESNATSGIKVSNTSHLGKTIILYFYPKDNTPGCTTEAMQFRDKYKDFVKAGATVFGPAVNVSTSRTVAWNTARALTFMKPCMDVARIPVHANVGMGVGGIPMNAFAPIDAVSRCSRACVDIMRLDGL